MNEKTLDALSEELIIFCRKIIKWYGAQVHFVEGKRFKHKANFKVEIA